MIEHPCEPGIKVWFYVLGAMVSSEGLPDWGQSTARLVYNRV